MEKKKGLEAIGTLQKLFFLDDFSCLCLEALLLWELRRRLGGLEEPEGAGMGVSRSELCDLWDAEFPRGAFERLRLFAEEQRAEYGTRFRLREEIFYYLTEGKIPEGRASRFSRVWDEAPEQEPDIPVYSRMESLIVSRRENGAEAPLLLHVYGERGSGRRENVRRLCREEGCGFQMLLADRILGEPPETRRAAVREIFVESRLQNRILGIYRETAAERTGTEALVKELAECFAGQDGLLFLITEEALPVSVWLEGRMEAAAFAIRKPDPLSARGLWEKYGARYGIFADEQTREILQRYAFTPGQIEEVCRQARNLAWSRGEKIPSAEELTACCGSQVEFQFEGKAKKLDGGFRWADLVLPAASMELLQNICAQVRYRNRVYGEWNFASRILYGRGNALLFAGPPGTGKTMAAQVMAHELRMDLYRVDLSAVVSKYIGETEKNLSRVFGEARKSLCILFFDEADVLFGKRTEVKDSQDKYSNMEAAFLLQKMEEYDGISILATNFQQNIDEAFKRRLKYTVEFPTPSAPERHAIWKRAFPAEAPLEENADLAFLAENFELTGSNIKNIAVNAAFEAAAEQGSIGMRHLVRALLQEYRKSGKLLTREELKQYCMYY